MQPRECLKGGRLALQSADGDTKELGSHPPVVSGVKWYNHLELLADGTSEPP